MRPVTERSVRKVVSQSKFTEQIFTQQAEQNWQIVRKLFFFSEWQNKSCNTWSPANV